LLREFPSPLGAETTICPVAQVAHLRLLSKDVSGCSTTPYEFFHLVRNVTLPGHQQAAAEASNGKPGKLLQFRKVG
jgi:hypothetical protein